MSIDEEFEKLKKRLMLTPEFQEARNKYKDAKDMYAKLAAINAERKWIEEGAGPETAETLHQKGRLTARERVRKLMDPGSFEELDLWHRPYETGFPIGEEHGRGDGVAVGYGAIDGRAVTVWAQDGTIMGGTVGTVHARKVNMIMRNALDAMTPIIGIFDSEGLRAHDIIQYPEYYSTSTMAFFQTMASGVIPKLALVMGPCVGDMAIIAGLSDFVFMVRGASHMHLAPPPPGATSREIGDAWDVHAKISGCCDVLAENEEECLEKARQ